MGQSITDNNSTDYLVLEHFSKPLNVIVVSKQVTYFRHSR